MINFELHSDAKYAHQKLFDGGSRLIAYLYSMPSLIVTVFFFKLSKVSLFVKSKIKVLPVGRVSE